MPWIALWALLWCAASVGLVASVNAARFGRRISREMRELPRKQPPADLDRAALDELPAPVRAYLVQALGDRTSPIRTVRIVHGGSFRTSLEGAWSPIRGRQSFVADPPGFVWWGRVRAMPGVWIDARDRSRGGEGSLRVTLDSTVPVFERGGPEIDQGALLRLLGEMVWFPTALLDRRYVEWTPIDGSRARATLRAFGREVSAVFSFGEDGLPVEVSAPRYRDVDAVPTLTPWSARMSAFRRVDGVLVPFRVVAFWRPGRREIPYARFDVESIVFDGGES